MATEINKNKKWFNKNDIKKRRRKVSNEPTINNIKSIINLFVSAVKTKHT
jgi:hypothetical protein